MSPSSFPFPVPPSGQEAEKLFTCAIYAEPSVPCIATGECRKKKRMREATESIVGK